MMTKHFYRRVIWLDRLGRRVVSHLPWYKTARQVVLSEDFQAWFAYDDGSRTYPQPSRMMKVVAAAWRWLSRYEKEPVRKLGDKRFEWNKPVRRVD